MNYLIGLPFIQSVASTTLLSAVDTTDFQDGALYALAGSGIYQLNKFSTEATSSTVFTADPQGRWIKTDYAYILVDDNGQIDPSQLSDDFLANGKIWVGNSSGVAAQVTMTGDVTITNAGVSSITAASIVLADLAAAIAPAAISKYTGKFTWTGGGATATAAVTGVAATDVVIATIQTKPTQAAYLVGATPSTNQIAFELSAANTSNDAVIAYEVFRATS